MSTIKDVAKRAGVSIATVSRVLNNKGKYTPDTGKKVRQAVQDLGYTVNLTAKSLKTGLTGTIGVLTREYSLLRSPEIIDSALKVLQTEDFAVEIILDADMHRSITLMQEGKYDGLLLIDLPRNENALRKLRDNSGNFVVLGGDTDREDVNLIQIDYFGGGYQATKELINLSHVNILFIEDNEGHYFTQEIKRGYLFALDENGIGYKEALLIKNNDDGLKEECLGYETLRRRIDEVDFSAVLATDDRIAYGVLSAAQEYGLLIPENLSVLGFGNMDQSKYSIPPLTTTETPTAQMGELGAEILVNNIRRKDSIVKRVSLQTQIVTRSTLAKRVTRA